MGRRPAAFGATALVVLLAVLLGAAGARSQSLPPVTALAPPPDGYDWRLPPGFPRPLVPADNPQSAAKVELGRRLFFDPGLSISGTVACASCHRPELAFTDGRSRASGATGALTRRSAMALINVAYNSRYGWTDPGFRTLEEQMLMPLTGTDPIEMGLGGREAALEKYLATEPVYADGFRTAFPQDPASVTFGNMVKAIASFERTLISGDSPFDRYLYRDEALSAAAKRGLSLFFSERVGCSGCHSGLNLAGNFAYQGGTLTPAVYVNTSTGAGQTIPYRVPTLRNVALTAPYMHDGSMQSLPEVLDHYAIGGRYRDAQTDRKLRVIEAFTGAEREDLLEFLNALTDRRQEPTR